MPPLSATSPAMMIGDSTAPTPKKKCRAFMNGPTRSRWTHTSRVLPPMSRMPAATPSTRRTANSSHSSGISGTSASMAAVTSRLATCTGWPGSRS